MVEARDWIAGKTLIDLKLPHEGVLVLGIRRAEGVYLGAPRGETVIRAGDVITLYGLVERIEELDRRRHGRAGDRAHQAAVDDHREDLLEQTAVDKELEESRQQAEEGETAAR